MNPKVGSEFPHENLNPKRFFPNLGECSETKKANIHMAPFFLLEFWFWGGHFWNHHPSPIISEILPLGFFVVVDIFAKILTTIIRTVGTLFMPSTITLNPRVFLLDILFFLRICCVDWWEACSIFPRWTDLWSSSDGSATCTVNGYLCCQCLESCSRR